VAKAAYLGSLQEVTLDTALGAIFVVVSDVEQPWQPGDRATLSLGARGVAVLART
jgi:iron(III) transport system ATP-binding protein